VHVRRRVLCDYFPHDALLNMMRLNESTGILKINITMYKGTLYTILTKIYDIYGVVLKRSVS